MSGDILIGSHLFRHEPTGIVFWKLVGDISEAEMRRLCHNVEVIAASQDYVLMLIDLSSLGAVAPGVRKVAAEASRRKSRGTGIFGASAHIRILSNFVIRAARLLQAPTDDPTRFFTTEAEARAWLAQRRRIVLKECG